ncbi:MAG: DUF1622 domain-containing protein [Pseudomonadota bacterium]
MVLSDDCPPGIWLLARLVEPGRLVGHDEDRSPGNEAMVTEIMEWLALGVDIIAVTVMLIGFVIGLWQFLPALTSKSAAEEVDLIQQVRCRLGNYLVLALELMIVSDLIHTVISHELEDLYFLGMLVAIRTVVSYFLNKEIQEIRERLPLS